MVDRGYFKSPEVTAVFDAFNYFHNDLSMFQQAGLPETRGGDAYVSR